MIAGVLLVICSLLLVKQTFDIPIFDTFYAIRLKYLYWLLAGLLIIYWIFYRYARKILFSKSLINIHIILTILVCILIIVFHVSSRQLPIGASSLDLYNVPLFQKNNLILTILLMLLAAVQCIFAFNFLWGLKVNGKR